MALARGEAQGGALGRGRVRGLGIRVGAGGSRTRTGRLRRDRPPRLHGAEEAASALARLFGALVLCLYPSEGAGRRLHWVAAGLVLLGAGHLFYGYLAPLFGASASPNEGLLAGLVVRTLSCVLFVVGLAPATPPRFSRRTALGLALAVSFAWAMVGLAQESGNLPAMVHTGSVESLTAAGSAPVPGFTGWHWALSVVPLILAVAATLGALRWVRSGELGGWLLVAMVLLAASQLHHAFWPSTYGSPVLTSADLLRLSFAGTVAVGGALELRKIAAERATLLAEERARIRTLNELSAMKADFTSMVAHELASPLLAVRSFAEVLAGEHLRPEERARMLAKLHEQADGLGVLVEDVRASAEAEREGFAIAPRQGPVAELLSGAASYAEALPGEHRLSVFDDTDDVRVLADPGRIGQVLRNLISNAAEYSPTDSQITLRAEPVPGKRRTRLSVSDRGFGIHPDDLERVFEKFGRGRDTKGRRVGGVGLGLYLSRQIVRSHGSDLTVSSAPGEGSVFAFELEASPRAGRGERR